MGIFTATAAWTWPDSVASIVNCSEYVIAELAQRKQACSEFLMFGWAVMDASRIAVARHYVVSCLRITLYALVYNFCQGNSRRCYQFGQPVVIVGHPTANKICCQNCLLIAVQLIAG